MGPGIPQSVGASVASWKVGMSFLRLRIMWDLCLNKDWKYLHHLYIPQPFVTRLQIPASSEKRYCCSLTSAEKRSVRLLSLMNIYGPKEEKLISLRVLHNFFGKFIEIQVIGKEQ